MTRRRDIVSNRLARSAVSAVDRKRRPLQALLWAIVVFSVATIPCTISTAGRDEFRAPKEFPLRGTGVLIAASLVLGYLFWAVELRQELKACRIPLYFGIAVVAWTTIVTATSLNPPLSVWNLIYACASMLTADISRLIGACPSNSRDRRSDESDALYS